MVDFAGAVRPCQAVDARTRLSPHFQRAMLNGTMEPDPPDSSMLLEFMALMRAAQEAERSAIARRLHNEAGQSMSFVKMKSYEIETCLRAADPEAADEFLELMEALSGAIATVREISEDLRPAILQFGAQASAEWLAQRFQSETGIACVVDAEIDSELLDPDRTTEVFRILQEALANVTFHTGATVVDILMRQNDGQMILQISDDGKWPLADEPPLHGLGILCMKERARRAGGAFAIVDFRIRIRLPLRLT